MIFRNEIIQGGIGYVDKDEPDDGCVSLLCHPHFGLHYHKGAAVSFMLLTKAFKDRNPSQAAMWAGSLVHSLGDEAACNHDPLIHYRTYALRPYKVEMGKGCGLDFSSVSTTPADKDFLQSMTADFKPSVLSEDPAEAFSQIMIFSIEANMFMTRRTHHIAASFAFNLKRAVQLLRSRTVLC